MIPTDAASEEQHPATEQAAALTAAMAEAREVPAPKTCATSASEDETLLQGALRLAEQGLRVFPLKIRDKVPLIAGGRGFYDATTDPARIKAWWARVPNANIGVRPPAEACVLDVDPRHGGDQGLAELELLHGQVPRSRVAASGRGDGGVHIWLRAPAGRLTASRLPRGIDLKTANGYVVAPPSLHPSNGSPYHWVHEGEPAAVPAWLEELLTFQDLLRDTSTVPRQRCSVPRRALKTLSGGAGKPSPADLVGTYFSWTDILQPHRWRLINGDGDSDGSLWAHPHATASHSASVKSGCLFVYSPNTPFDVTVPGKASGYTKFRAYAVLNHGHDLSRAALAVMLGYRFP